MTATHVNGARPGGRAYQSARRTQTVYEGVLPDRLHPDGTGGVIIVIVLAYVLPARLVFPPLTDLGRPSTLVAFGLLVWWGMSRLHPTLVTRGRQPMRWALVFYFATMAMSYAAGSLRGLTGLEVNSADRTVLAALAGAGVLLAAADGVLTRDRIDRVLRWLVIGASVMAFFALTQFVLRIDITGYLKLPPVLQFKRELVGFSDRGAGGLTRVAGTAGHYIEFSVLMVIALLVAIHFARFAENRRDRQLYGAAAALCAGVVPISISRTGILALVAAMFLFMLVWPLRTSFNVLVVGVVLAAGLQVTKPGLLGTLRSLLFHSENDPSVQGRVEDYAYVTPLIKERPWLGRGVGTFIPELYRLLDNQWLVTLVSTGVIGVLGFAGLFLSGIVLAGRVRRFVQKDRDRDLATVFAVGIGVLAISAFTFDALFFTTYVVTMNLLLGLAGALWRVTRAERMNAAGSTT